MRMNAKKKAMFLLYIFKNMNVCKGMFSKPYILVV